MGKGSINICIDCEKSGGLCPWSANLKPIDGWTATPLRKRYNDNYIVDGYHVTACPLFEKTARPERDDLWTVAEIEALKNFMRQRLDRKSIATILGRSVGAVSGQMTKLRKENKYAPR
jgi:hypothetical protein